MARRDKTHSAGLDSWRVSIAHILIIQRLEQRIAGVRVVNDGNLGGYFVGEIEELFAGGDGHRR